MRRSDSRWSSRTVWVLLPLSLACSPGSRPADPDDSGHPDAAGDGCVRYVNRAAGSGGDGLSWETAFTEVQAGIGSAAMALTGDGRCEVWVAEGVYHVFGGSEYNTVRLIPEVDVYGGFQGNETELEERDVEQYPTILDGHRFAGSEERVLHVVTGADDATLDGFIVTGGFAHHGTSQHEWFDSYGAGMLVLDASPRVANCVFRDNLAEGDGGGMAILRGSPEITGCVFDGNHAGYCGGGMTIRLPDSEPVVTDCLFENNTAAYMGGGMSNELDAKAVVSGCEFVGNVAWHSGGGMGNNGARPLVTSCIFRDNEGLEAGGGMANDGGGHATVENSLFAGNSAVRFGGAVCNHASSPQLSNCVLAGNTAGEFGGAIFNDAKAAARLLNCTISLNSAVEGGGAMTVSTYAPVVRNSILWNNSPDEICNQPGTPIWHASYNCIRGSWEGEGNIDADPLFSDAGGGDFRLQAGSPCIDAANGDVAMEKDFDGAPRGDDEGMQNTGLGPPWADIGAFEYVP